MEIKLKNLPDKFERFTLSNGLKVQIFKSLDGIEAAYHTTFYGSLHTKYQIKDQKYHDPSGIAHYLEHLMFAKKSGDYFADYSKIGANANAYTSFQQTTYLVETQKNFPRALKILLKQVQTLYLTDAIIQKEFGIISEEIRMYDDSDDWVAFRGILENIAITNNYNQDIAGTIDAIKQITKQDLERIFKTFYHPTNQVLVITTNLDSAKIISILEENITHPRKIKVKLEIKKEPNKINKKQVLLNHNKEKPHATIAIKMPNKQKSKTIDPLELIKWELFLISKFSKTSDLYNNLSQKGLIIGQISVNLIYDEYLKALTLTVYTDKPKIVVKSIEQAFSEKISFDEFSMAQKYLIGEFIRSFEESRVIIGKTLSLYQYGILYNVYWNKLLNLKFLDIKKFKNSKKYHISTYIIK